jgi:hypothetical protein
LKRQFNEGGRELVEIPPEELFGTIVHQGHLAACVTAAQAALLNPMMAAQAGGAKVFLPDELRQPGGCEDPKPLALPDISSKSEHELDFTGNVIVLEIEGAEADLTIVDLPGIIQVRSGVQPVVCTIPADLYSRIFSTTPLVHVITPASCQQSSSKGQRYVDMVKKMVVDNISPAHVRIVMTLTGIDDRENQVRGELSWRRDAQLTGGLPPDILPCVYHTQAIHLIAQEVDPLGVRTIGVITKADLIEASALG